MQNAINQAEINTTDKVGEQETVKKETKSELNSLKSKIVIGAVVLATSSSLSQNLNAQTQTNKPQSKVETVKQSNVANDSNTARPYESKVETLDQNNPLDFVTLNIAKTFPDMQKHRNDIKDKFYSKEQKDSTIKFLNETVMKAGTTDQKVAGVLVGFENTVMIAEDITQDFSNSPYAENVPQKTLDLTTEFDNLYSAWFKEYYARMQKDIEEMKKEIEIIKQENNQIKQENNQIKQENNQIKQENNQIKQENKMLDQEISKSATKIINMMNKFTIQQVKSDNNLKQTIIGTIDAFKKAGIQITTHMELLLKAAQ